MKNKNVKVSDAGYEDFDQLTEREKCIYKCAYSAGSTSGALFTYGVMIILIICLIATHAYFKH